MKKYIQSLAAVLLTAGSLQAALVAEWKFDDNSGTNAVDSVGGYDGTVAKSTEWVSGGVSGGALNFANTNEVAVPIGVFDTIQNEVTLSMWIFGNEQQPVSDYCFAALTDTGGKVLTTHVPYGDNKIVFDTGNASTGYERVWAYPPNTSIYKGRWNHWVLTKNAATGEKNMYVNGELFANATGKMKIISNAAKVTIGSKGGSFFYQGMMDEVQLYDTALTALEVAALFDSYGYVPPNLPPVAEPASFPVIENTPVDFTLPGSDPEGSNVTYTIVSQPAFGTLATNGALPDMTYTPNTDYLGFDSFTYTVNDGEFESDPGTITFEVKVATAWNPAQTISGDSDVSTNGWSKFAAAFTQSTNEVTVNGVVFKAGNGLSSAIRNSSIYGSDLNYTVDRNSDTAFNKSGAAPFASLSEEYKTLLQSGLYHSNLREITFTLGNLTPGNSYELQIWIQDERNQGDPNNYGRYATVDGITDIDFNTLDAPGGLGQYAIATFTPSTTEYSFTVVGKNDLDQNRASFQLNALQLRDITPPIVGDISMGMLSGGTNVTLSWETSIGALYGVKASGNLANGGWDNIISNVPGNGAEVTVTNAVSAGVEFYRAYIQ